MTEGSNNASRELTECMICLDRAPNTLVLPCMHQVVCTICSRKLRESNDKTICVRCRRPIESILEDELIEAEVVPTGLSSGPVTGPSSQQLPVIVVADSDSDNEETDIAYIGSLHNNFSSTNSNVMIGRFAEEDFGLNTDSDSNYWR